MTVEIVFIDHNIFGALVPVILDAATEEIHRISSVATENEVERGVDVTDHVRPERRELQITGIISDTPIVSNEEISVISETVDINLPPRLVYDQLARFRGVNTPQIVDRVNLFSAAAPQSQRNWEIEKVGSRNAPQIRATLLKTEDGIPITRIADSWLNLRVARDNAQLATITTRLETYESMVLIEAQCVRTAADGSWIRVALTFAEIRQVETQTVEDRTPDRPRGRRQVNRGSQSPTPAPETEEYTSPVMESAAFSALN